MFGYGHKQIDLRHLWYRLDGQIDFLEREAFMKKRLKGVLAGSMVMAILAFGSVSVWSEEEDPIMKEGLKIFLKKDAKKNSCNTCHPKGGSDGSIIDGKKVPDLKKVIANKDMKEIENLVKKQIKKRTTLTLTNEEVAILIKFVARLGGKK